MEKRGGCAAASQPSGGDGDVRIDEGKTTMCSRMTVERLKVESDGGRRHDTGGTSFAFPKLLQFNTRDGGDQLCNFCGDLPIF